MIVSVVRPALASFSPPAKGRPLNGANLADARALRAFANAADVEAVEVFLLPREMVPAEGLAACAEAILEPRNRGKGRLRFHALPNLPAVWADGASRVLFCQDLFLLARERYLRDRFAKGPTVLLSDVHCLGHRDIWASFRELAAFDPVSFDRIVATSRSLAAGVDASFEALEAPLPMPTMVWHRAVDLETFRPAGEEERRQTRRTLGLPEGATIALHLSRLTPNDKADLLPLIDAFADVAGGDDLLLVAGVENEPGYAQALRDRARARSARVEIRTEVAPGTQALVYAAADLFVFPGDTVQEAIPTVIAEAMACGLPVVASDWDGARDLVEHERSGLLVPTVMVGPPDEIEALFPASDFRTDFLAMGQSVWIDRDALGSALARLLRDPSLRARMGAAGRRFAEDRLSLADWTRGMVDLGRRLLSEAADEPPARAEARRARTEGSAMAMPFGRIFAPYASRVAGPGDRVALTPEGHRARAGRPAAFYDAVLAYLTPTLVASALRAVEIETTLGAAVARIALETAVPEGRARFALALLLKRGYATLVEGPSVEREREI